MVLEVSAMVHDFIGASHLMAVRKKRELHMACTRYSLFYIYSTLTLNHWDDVIYFHTIFPQQLILSEDTTSDISKVVLFLHATQSSKVALSPDSLKLAQANCNYKHLTLSWITKYTWKLMKLIYWSVLIFATFDISE